MRQRRQKTTDPLLRDCPACGALVGKGCISVGKGGRDLPLIPRATRLVHADRLNEKD